MVKVSSPTFPNWRRTVSSSPFPPGWLWSIVATSWKFFTDATVTRPWKFKHQHCKCSCHLGALFRKTVKPEEADSSCVIFELSTFLTLVVSCDTGHLSEQTILLGPLDFKRLNLYETCPTSKLPAGTWGLICLLANRRLALLLEGLAPLCGGWLSYIVKLVPRKSELQHSKEQWNYFSWLVISLAVPEPQPFLLFKILNFIIYKTLNKVPFQFRSILLL